MTTTTWAALARLTGERQAELDGKIAAWRTGDGAGARLWCGTGCGNCCTLAVNATLPEALAVAAALDDGQRRRLSAVAERITGHARRSTDARSFLAGYRQTVGPCPFLAADASCSIYAHRPLACRALLSTRPPDWCGVNLAELPEYERNAFLASLERSVVAYPTHYAAVPRQLATEYERGLILATIRFAGFGVTGNLPLLTWLVSQPGWDGAMLAGTATFHEFLAARRIDQPVLVQLHVP